MDIAFKLWLLAVVCATFLYQDGPQGNGVLCVKKDTQSNKSTKAAFSEEDSADNQNSDSSGGGDSDGSGVGKNDDDSSVEDDDDDDDDDDEEHDEKSKKKHTSLNTNKQSGKGKNHHDDHDNDDEDEEENEDEEDGEDGEDEEDKEDKSDKDDEKNKDHNKNSKSNIKYKRNNDDKAGEMQLFTTTTITGKPKAILKLLDSGLMPYKPAVLDSKKKSNSKLFKKIEGITKKSKSSKGKIEPNDLGSFMNFLINESSNKKNDKHIDINSKEVFMTFAKSLMLQFVKNL